MDSFPTRLELSAIVREVATVPVATIADGSGHAGDGHDGGWINGLRNYRLFLDPPQRGGQVIDRLADYPTIRELIAELMETTGHYDLRQVMVNRLETGGTLAAHRDGLPDDWRYHFPVETNSGVAWWDEYNGTLFMAEGHWHGPVPYCGVLHSVANNGPTQRIHIVADFKKHV